MNTKTIKIDEITLTVNGQRLILTVEELKALRDELDSLLGDNVVTPVYHPSFIEDEKRNSWYGNGPTC